MKTMNTMHRTILKISGGRIGWKAGNMPALELTTTGRKSGQPRTSMLTSPWQDGDKLAIVASAGGNDSHPAWFLNLRDHPEVEVRTEKGSAKMTARITSGDERATLWDAHHLQARQLRGLSDQDRSRDPDRRARAGRMT